MKTTNTNGIHILAIAPVTRGFGYAVFEEQGTLVNWGERRVDHDKNAGALAKVEKLMDEIQPAVMVLEKTSAKGSLRSPRIQELIQNIITLATSRKIKVRLFSREQVIRAFFENGKGTNHGVAQIVAKRYPDELGFRLPPKRILWKSESHAMSMFFAVALAVTYRMGKRKRLPISESKAD